MCNLFPAYMLGNHVIWKLVQVKKVNKLMWVNLINYVQTQFIESSF